MTGDLSKIDRLVSDFEAGHGVETVLAEINSDESLLFDWGHNHFDDQDCSFLVHEREIFVLEDSLEEYFDLDELRSIRDDQVAQFICDRFEGSFDGEVRAVHFFEISGSVISAIGDLRGQHGFWFVDLDISKTRERRYQNLLDTGYLFLPNDYFVIPSELLLQKFQKFIRDRLNEKK